MSRSNHLVAALVIAGVLLATSSDDSAKAREGSEAAKAPGAPVEDIVLITLDTLRADALGFAGNARAETPVLDRLAAGGLVFDNARAHNVVTLPSHANILTGRLPYEHGIRHNSGFVLPGDLPTAATLLGSAGFTTGAFVAAFPLEARYGLGRGFDVYDDELPEARSAMRGAERRGDEVVAKALEWWQGQTGKRRFLWLHLYDPHAPYDPPAPFASRFPDDPYLGEVAATDAFLEPLLAPLIAAGPKSVLVVVTSDHGEALGDHGELTHGLFAYEATLRVPLVLWGSGIQPGRSSTPASHIDLLPTLLAAAGVAPPDGLRGSSLLTSGETEGGPPLYFEVLGPALDGGWAPLRGVVREGWKWIALPLPELYNLLADPAESLNLVNSERRRARELHSLLPDESVWPPKRGSISAEEAARLRSLGYLAGEAKAKTSYGPEDDPKRLLELDNNVHRAIDLYHRGRLEEAEALIRRVVEARPDMGIAYDYWAQILLQAQQTAAALEVMATAMKRDIASAALKRQLGMTLTATGRVEEALAILAPLAADGDPDAQAPYGAALAEAGRVGEAEKVLRAALAEKPNDAQLLQNLALAALRGSKWNEARQRAERALDVHPELALAWNYLGAARYNLGDRRGALDAWERAVALEPENYDVLFNIALVAGEVGDRDAARDALRRFVAGAPPDRYGPDIERARGWLDGLGG